MTPRHDQRLVARKATKIARWPIQRRSVEIGWTKLCSPSGTLSWTLAGDLISAGASRLHAWSPEKISLPGTRIAASRKQALCQVLEVTRRNLVICLTSGLNSQRFGKYGVGSKITASIRWISETPAVSPNCHAPLPSTKSSRVHQTI